MIEDQVRFMNSGGVNICGHDRRKKEQAYKTEHFAHSNPLYYLIRQASFQPVPTYYIPEA
jgi:hypothetical protein